MGDTDVIKAARIVVKDYPEAAIQFLVGLKGHDPRELLQTTCNIRGHNYYEVMSKNGPVEDDTRSSSSLHRPPSRASITAPSALDSSSSTNPSTLSSGNGHDRLWVRPEPAMAAKTLTVNYLPQSDCLITSDTVRRHVKLSHQPYSGREVSYNGGTLQCLGTVEIEWARSLHDLKENKVQKNVFHIVDELESQVVLCGVEHEDNPANQPGGPRPEFNTIPTSHGNRSQGLHSQMHGLHLQQTQGNKTHTANSTSATARPIISSANRRPKEHQQSTSSGSRIPKSVTSTGSVRTASSGGRASPRMSTPILHSPTPNRDIRVIIIWGRMQLGSTKLQLSAPGAIFFQHIKQHIAKRNGPRELNPNDLVRFSAHMEGNEPSCLIKLLEEEVDEEWDDAVTWLGGYGKSTKIYAFIESDDD